jgi:hypothetical protein
MICKADLTVFDWLLISMLFMDFEVNIKSILLYIFNCHLSNIAYKFNMYIITLLPFFIEMLQ